MELNGDDDHVSEFSAARTPNFEERNTRPNLSMSKDAGRKAAKIGGGSVNARQVEALGKRIHSPIRCVGSDWYCYDSGKWKLVVGGKDRYKPLALKVQDSGNVNVRRAEDTLKHFEYAHQLGAGERFYGAIQYIPGQSTYAINCANCVLCLSIETGRIEGVVSHAPEFMFTKSIGEYRHDASCRRFRTIVMPQILPDLADRKLVWDFACYCLLPHSRFQQAMFFIGSGENGKSLIAETIANAIGRDVKSNVTLHQLCSRDQKHMMRLEKMLTNVSTETDYKVIEDHSAFNALVSGEDLSIAEMFKEGRSMTSNVKPWFLMNHIPQFKHGSYAVSRRMLIVHFGQTFDKNRNVHLEEELKDEYSGILAYIVKRLPRVVELNKLVGGGKASLGLTRNFANNNDIIHSYVSSCLRGKPNRMDSNLQDVQLGYYCSNEIIFNIFRQYCVEVGHDYQWTIRQFLRRLRECCPDFSYDIPKWSTIIGENSVRKSSGNVSKTIGPLALTELGLRYLKTIQLGNPRKLDRIIAEGRNIC